MISLGITDRNLSGLFCASESSLSSSSIDGDLDCSAASLVPSLEMREDYPGKVPVNGEAVPGIHSEFVASDYFPMVYSSNEVGCASYDPSGVIFNRLDETWEVSSVSCCSDMQEDVSREVASLSGSTSIQDISAQPDPDDVRATVNTVVIVAEWTLAQVTHLIESCLDYTSSSFSGFSNTVEHQLNTSPSLILEKLKKLREVLHSDLQDDQPLQDSTAAETDSSLASSDTILGRVTRSHGLVPDLPYVQPSILERRHK